MKRVLVLLAVVLLSGCGIFPIGGTSPSPADAITYEVVGANVVGTASITMATPTGALLATSPAGPTFVFTSGVIAGYNQFNTIKPNVTVVGYGCFDVYVLVNAQQTRKAHDCGQPITVSSQ